MFNDSHIPNCDQITKALLANSSQAWSIYITLLLAFSLLYWKQNAMIYCVTFQSSQDVIEQLKSFHDPEPWSFLLRFIVSLFCVDGNYVSTSFVIFGSAGLTSILLHCKKLQKWHATRRNFMVGDIVIDRDNGFVHWPLAKVNIHWRWQCSTSSDCTDY